MADGTDQPSHAQGLGEMSAGGVPAEEAVLVALGCLPRMGPARLTALLARFEPAEIWDRLQSRQRSDLVAALADVRAAASVVDEWMDAARSIDVESEWVRHREAGVRVFSSRDPLFPDRFREDPEPPALVFVRGEPDVLAGPCVAIVGTRRCSRYGFDVARDLGRDLAANGVCVVSGLALGIDAAAHLGALAGEGVAPAGVVGTGLDVIYPKANKGLWADVAARGVVVSEAPLGTRPERWRFPARNRLIAALADVVIVVESHEAGGSLHTVTEALVRDRTVMAVPGSIRSSAASGTNQLLHDGCGPCRGVDDVLTALGLDRPARPANSTDRRPRPGEFDASVLEQLGWEPVTVDQLALATGAALGLLTAALERLVRTGWLTCTGGWYERCR